MQQASRRFKARHPEKVRESKKDWNRRNRDKVREMERRTRERYPEKTKLWATNWRKQNPEKARAVNRESKKRYPERIRACASRRRARLAKATVEHFIDIEIFERDNWTCQLCGKKVDRRVKCPHPNAVTLDHIIPLAKGGEHSRANTQCACHRCNVTKSDRMIGQLRIF